MEAEIPVHLDSVCHQTPDEIGIRPSATVHLDVGFRSDNSRNDCPIAADTEFGRRGSEIELTVNGETGLVHDAGSAHAVAAVGLGSAEDFNAPALGDLEHITAAHVNALRQHQAAVAQDKSLAAQR